MTEIPTGLDGRGPKLYLATVIDLYSRRLLSAATGRHPDAELACAALTMAVAVRGGRSAIWREDEAERVIFHTDRGSTYTANAFPIHYENTAAPRPDSRIEKPSTIRGEPHPRRCGRRTSPSSTPPDGTRQLNVALYRIAFTQARHQHRPRSSADESAATADARRRA